MHDNPKGFNPAVLAIIDFLNGDRGTGKCFCPCHDDGSNPSLQVGNGEKVPVVVYCFGVNTKEHNLEVIAYLKAQGQWPTSDALAGDQSSAGAQQRRSPKDRRRYALGIWNELRRLKKKRDLTSWLEPYLQGRAIKQVPSTAVIALPIAYPESEVGSHNPGMVLPVRDKTGNFQGIHVIWLNKDMTAKRESAPQRQSYGLMKGNFIELTKYDPKVPLKKLIVAEGPETALAMMQLTGIPAIATGGKGFMKDIDPPIADEYIIAPDCDDDGASRDDAGILAQRLVGRIVRIAMPNRPEQGKSGYDWNDALVDAGDKDDKIEQCRKAIIDAPMFDAVMVEKEKREVRLNALAALKLDDPMSYEQERLQAHRDLNVRASVLDDEVERRCKLLRERKKEPEKPNIELLAASAREIIRCNDVLEHVGEYVGKFIAGEKNTARLIYLAGTSRLFDKAMHVAVKGASSGGKSELRKRVVAMFPPESVIEFTALSEKALLYHSGGFEHKILSMGEALPGEETKFQDYLLRVLMSENELIYRAPMKVGGKIETVEIVKHGPVCFIVTTTRNALNPENETRMLSLEIDDSEQQTARVVQKVAQIEGYGRAPVDADLKVWHDFQRFLAAGETRVFIPFAKTLARLLGSTRSVRLRRDFGQLLRAVKAHALIHREQRRRNDDGCIVATLDGDYAAVRTLMAELLATASEIKTRKAIVDTVAAVDALDQQKKRDGHERMRENAGVSGITVREIADQMRLDRSAAYRRLRAAEDAGLITNIEERKGRTARFQVSADIQVENEKPLLPSAENGA